MSQKDQYYKFSIKKLAISVLIQFLALIVFSFLFSYFLLKIPKYENYMIYAIWGITLLISFINAWLSARNSNLALPYAGIGAFIFSLFCFALGLIFSKSNALSLHVVIRLAAFIVFSLFFSMLFIRSSKRKRKGQKFRFSK